ncbi:MAG TPA: hypothetical protein VE154_05330 [Chthoniobacterales bacterium]|nr:hypothetical protein [Chthoniobacterales bacterium]
MSIVAVRRLLILTNRSGLVVIGLLRAWVEPFTVWERLFRWDFYAYCCARGGIGVRAGFWLRGDC